MSELSYEDVPQDTAAGGGVPASAKVMSSAAIEPQEKVIVSPLNGTAIIASPDTAARARAGKAAKRERLREAALSGMLTATQAVAAGVFTHEQAWGKIIEGQTELALSPDLRGSTQAAALVGKAIGATERERDDTSHGNSITISLSEAAVTQIAAALAGKLDGDE